MRHLRELSDNSSQELLAFGGARMYGHRHLKRSSFFSLAPVLHTVSPGQSDVSVQLMALARSERDNYHVVTEAEIVKHHTYALAIALPGKFASVGTVSSQTERMSSIVAKKPSRLKCISTFAHCFQTHEF